ncbi:MAG: hypothetical protein GY906_02440 [bacterium]|nr:hypothetical protein [bacterium]
MGMLDPDVLLGNDGLLGIGMRWKQGRRSSEQRVRWFTHGLNTGDPDQCDTFVVADP